MENVLLTLKYFVAKMQQALFFVRITDTSEATTFFYGVNLELF